MFHQEKVVSETGTVRPSRLSVRNEPGVAAVSGPEPEYPMCHTTNPENPAATSIGKCRTSPRSRACAATSLASSAPTTRPRPHVMREAAAATTNTKM